MPLYPLLLAPIYKEKVWGGRGLEQLGRVLPGGPDTLIGESWELADLSMTSPSGGGGEAARSVIRNGPLMKRTFGDVTKDFGPVVSGTMQLSPDGSFPLLLKYLDARENLSVQVHPSGAYAAEHPDVHCKSEAWYVVAADPGAKIYRGVIEGVDHERFQKALQDGSITTLLRSEPAKPGQCIYLPSGTVHALGGGVLVAEVQTASDTTFRVFDWGRTDRELHVDEALACVDFSVAKYDTVKAGRGVEVDGGWLMRPLVSCEHFQMHEWTARRGESTSFVSGELHVLMVIRGAAMISWGDQKSRTLTVAAGDTVVLPAGLASAEVRAEIDLTLLEVTQPRTPS
ncbi:class I mannose-6-phosphate isomerase [Gemmatimonadales bacterium]|nr:class I mannose-6-phosphate isomerase [Gemmatimonadales bacterium]